jgi:DNA (cytosine-5)-methyltransferase 1
MLFMAKSQYKFIDLFSGCGGFSTGLEMAGHKCLLGIDFDAEAVKSFKKNHQDAHALHMDIHDLTKKKLESLIDIDSVDMVIGGPPCQGFSTVGKGDSQDERNSLFQQFVRIVKVTNPKIVIFENVTGILAKKNQKVLHRIYESFEKLGYHMDAKVLSADEYGVPSRRRRTIIMGVKDGLPLYPKSVYGKQGTKPFVTVAEAFKNLKAKNGKIYNHEVEKAQLKNELDIKRLKHIPAGAGIRYQKDELAYLPKNLRYGIDWNKVSEKRFRQTRLQRLDLKTPSPTILTSRTSYYHPIEPRYLTVREAAKCQSFPNDFIFEGSQTAQFRQIGNAVPPMLAMAIGLEIKKINFNLKSLKRQSLKKRTDIKDKAFNYREQNYA